jgi:hypothetical protein
MGSAREALDEAITYALSLVTKADAQAWIAFCGYRLQPAVN